MDIAGVTVELFDPSLTSLGASSLDLEPLWSYPEATFAHDGALVTRAVVSFAEPVPNFYFDNLSFVDVLENRQEVIGTCSVSRIADDGRQVDRLSDDGDVGSAKIVQEGRNLDDGICGIVARDGQCGLEPPGLDRCRVECHVDLERLARRQPPARGVHLDEREVG